MAATRRTTPRGAALELAVLGLLDTPMHGYELRKHLIALLGLGRVLSYGTLYPCLKGLVRRGLIIADEDTEAIVRGRRNRIVYRLTADGKEFFAQAMEESGPSAWDDESFGVRFAFFSRTTSSTRVRILEGRRSRLQERLEHVRQATQRGPERVDSYTQELQRHGLESVQREVRWLDDLIDRERSGGYDAPQTATGQHPGTPHPTAQHPTTQHPTTQHPTQTDPGATAPVGTDQQRQS